MRTTYYPGVCTKPGTHYQGWFMYMSYTQEQNEDYLQSRSMYQTRYLLSEFLCMCIYYMWSQHLLYLCVHLISAHMYVTYDPWIHTYIRTYSTHIVATHAHMDTYVHTYIQYAHRSNPCSHGYICTYVHTVRTS